MAKHFYDTYTLCNAVAIFSENCTYINQPKVPDAFTARWKRVMFISYKVFIPIVKNMQYDFCFLLQVKQNS